METAMFEKNI